VPHQLGVQERVAESQRFRLAPFQEVLLAGEQHHVGREPFADTRPSNLNADAVDAAEDPIAGPAFLAAGRRRRRGKSIESASEQESVRNVHLANS